MKRTTLMAALAGAGVLVLLGVSSQYKASSILFADADTLQAKQDAGSLAGSISSADCSGVTTGVDGMLCQETGDDTLWRCTTTTCNAAGWTTVGGTSTTPGGSDTQIQFNDGGVFGGDADLTWNKTSHTLTSTAGPTVLNEVKADNGSQSDPSFTFSSSPGEGLFAVNNEMHYTKQSADQGEINAGPRTTSAADCSGVTTGVQGDLCQETADNSLWRCTTSTCNAAGWEQVGFTAGTWSITSMVRDTVFPAAAPQRLDMYATTLNAVGLGTEVSFVFVPGGSTYTINTFQVSGLAAITDGSESCQISIYTSNGTPTDITGSEETTSRIWTGSTDAGLNTGCQEGSGTGVENLGQTCTLLDLGITVAAGNWFGVVFDEGSLSQCAGLSAVNVNFFGSIQ